MARRAHHEEHQNHEAWAIPYGDLVTLLLAFFVVMYSISSVNSGKYRVLSDALNAAFRGEPQREVPFTAELRQEGIPTPNVVAVPNPTSPQGTAAGQQTQLQLPVRS